LGLLLLLCIQWAFGFGAKHAQNIQRHGAALAQHNGLDTVDEGGQSGTQCGQIELAKRAKGCAHTLTKLGIGDLSGDGGRGGDCWGEAEWTAHLAEDTAQLGVNGRPNIRLVTNPSAGCQ
jgi:hypothetical protein